MTTKNAKTKAAVAEVAGHLKAIAARDVAAFDNFAACLVENFGQTEAAAEKITRLFIKHKLVKHDRWMGRLEVKHGGYLDAEFLKEVAAYEEA